MLLINLLYLYSTILYIQISNTYRNYSAGYTIKSYNFVTLVKFLVSKVEP